MSNNELHLPAQQQVSEEKKNAAFKKLVERGKQSGHLSAQEIDNVIVELDLDVDELEKLNEMIDSANISIVDDFSAEALDGIPLEVWRWAHRGRLKRPMKCCWRWVKRTGLLRLSAW